MSEIKILIADDRHKNYQQEKEAFRDIDAEIIIEKSLDEDVLAEKASDADAVLVNLAPMNRKVISAMQKCKCVCRYGVGYDNVDVDALKEKGIILTNVPDYCQEDVSDHALALLMDCVRKVSRKDRAVRRGEWNLTGVQPIFRLKDKIFGFVGYGGIGKCLHRKIDGFGMSKVLIYDPYLDADAIVYDNAELVSLEELCSQADYISIHAPLNDETRGLIGQKQFEMMKEGVIVINTSRGGLIDTDALISALKSKEGMSAGLDVFENEPLEEGSDLRNLENITMSDHSGWYSEESAVELKTKAAANVLSVLKNEEPKYKVKI